MEDRLAPLVDAMTEALRAHRLAECVGVPVDQEHQLREGVAHRLQGELGELRTRFVDGTVFVSCASQPEDSVSVSDRAVVTVIDDHLGGRERDQDARPWRFTWDGWNAPTQ